MKGPSGSLHGSTLGPLHTCCNCLVWGSYRAFNSGGGAVSDSVTCIWDPFPPTGWPCPGSIWGLCLVLLYLSMTCSVTIHGMPALLFFLMGNRKGVYLREKRGGWETRKRGGREYGVWDILYERIVN